MSDLVSRLAKLPADRRAEILALLRDDDEPPVSPVPVRRPRGDTGPVSFAQETLWFLQRLAPDVQTYNTPICFRLTGRLNVTAFRRAFADLIARHEMLRTSIAEGPDGPVQTVHPSVPADLPLVEASGTDVEQRRAHAAAVVSALVRQPFPLEQAPVWRVALVRIDDEEYQFIFVIHHVLFDGWSLGVFCADLADRYRAWCDTDDPAPLAPTGLDYPDYAMWQRDWLTSERIATLAEYWRTTLAGAPVLEFPTDRPRPPVQTYRGAMLRRRFTLTDPSVVARLARTLRTTPNMIYTTMFFTLLHRFTGQDDLVIGTPNANREYAEVEPVIGYFINMLVLRADVGGDPAFRELVGRVNLLVGKALEHGGLPFGKLVETIRPARDPSRSPLFQVVFVYQNTDGSFGLPQVDTERIHLDQGTSRFDLSMQLYEHPDGIEFAIEYNTDLFDESTMDSMATAYVTVLEAVTADPDLRVSAVPLLRPEQRKQLLTAWNGVTRPVPATTVAHLFAEQVARDPQAVAVVAGEHSMSYAELDRRANQLAHRLCAAGAGPGRLVALCLPRQPELIVAMVGVLKAGAGYVPLDPTHPDARLATIVADCAPVAVLATEATAAKLRGVLDPTHSLICVDAPAELVDLPGDHGPDLLAGPDDLAYVLYTSGSTGTPKGVVIEHHAVVNFIRAVQELFELTPADRVLGFAASTFDVSVFETFAALLTGARLYLAADDERLELDRLHQLLEECAITVTDMPPSLMALLEPERLPQLRIAFVGGEAFPGDLVNRWNQGRRFFNGYGPTECTVTMIVQECLGQWDASPPIGLPIVNHVAHVLDRRGELVPVGVAGELVIGGAGLARGYLGQLELTAEKFYADPFGTAPGGRLYRTGDLVKRRRDGAIVFLGRIDHQVKIRGLRIELGEIEAVLSQLAEVDQVAVEPYQDEQGDKHLVCYVAGRGARPEPAALRDFLAGRLPAYMVPAQFVVLDSLPLTTSGKVDRRQLPAPDLANRLTDGPIEYASDVEQVLATEIVGFVLGLGEVPPEQNFFELGGHSLAAARVVSRIRSRYGIEMSLSDFFRAPTVRGLAGLVAARQPAMTDDQLFAMLESMTDDEAAALLTDGPAATER